MDLLDETCPEHEKAIQTCFEKCQYFVGEDTGTSKTVTVYSKKCNAGSDLSLIDLKSVPMLKKLIQLWAESDFRASKNKSKKCLKLIYLIIWKQRRMQKGIRRNGFERLENALRNGQTGLLIEVLKK